MAARFTMKLCFAKTGGHGGPPLQLDPMISQANNSTRHQFAVGVVIAVVYFTLHLATSTRYGYFRDALYYLACAEHPALGYVDQPPLIAVLGWIARHTFGTSLPALLFWPALAGASRIILTAAFARELGRSDSELCWRPCLPQRRACGG